MLAKDVDQEKVVEKYISASNEASRRANMFATAASNEGKDGERVFLDSSASMGNADIRRLARFQFLLLWKRACKARNAPSLVASAEPIAMPPAKTASRSFQQTNDVTC